MSTTHSTGLLIRIGLGLFLLGAAGDIAHHALPHALTHDVDPVLGAEAYRAHLATLLGMFAVVAGPLGKGVRLAYNR